MRQNLLRTNRDLLTYPIREIAVIAKKIQEISGEPIIWENIGDPIAAGESVPKWLNEILIKHISKNSTYSYTETKGDIEARQYVLDNFSNSDICSTEDIVFFNGLGEAINKIFDNLPKEARVIVPSPTYPSHATAEAMHAGTNYLSYHLDPDNEWEPNLQEIENSIKYNPNIVAILVINPNNPTATVHKKSTLIKIVEIAKKYNCFLIFDEIYHHMVFPEIENTLLHQIIGDVPGISLKGMSKDIPWPGSRCGWMEVYNSDKDQDFAGFIDMMVLSKMLEVCSTTLPQKTLPDIFSHPKFRPTLDTRIEKYQRRSIEAYQFFKNIPQIKINPAKGVFYLIVELIDLPYSKLNIKNSAVRSYLDLVEQQDITPDFQFAYELLGATNICVVPLTGFGSQLNGFRMTLLQEDDLIFTQTLIKIGEAIKEYYTE